jgi:hypothetical protein
MQENHFLAILGSIHLFKPVEGETVLEAVSNQIELLGEANKTNV